MASAFVDAPQSVSHPLEKSRDSHAVVLGHSDDGSVRLWEPAHGEVVARARATYVPQLPGSRAYASAGLPGAGWWVAGSADGVAQGTEVELDEVHASCTENGLWSAAFEVSP